MSTFTGVAKGELGKFCEAYLRTRGAKIDIDGPLTQYENLPGGKVKYCIQRSRDVPRWIGNDAISNDFGITGNDVVLDEFWSGNDRIGISGLLENCARDLGFENILGKLVVLGREGYESKKDRFKAVVSDYYPNIARIQMGLLGLQPNDYELKIVQGAVEGYISSGACDLGIDTVYSGKTISKENKGCSRYEKPGIIIVKKIIDTMPIIVYDNKKFGCEDFDNLFMTKANI